MLFEKLFKLIEKKKYTIEFLTPVLIPVIALAVAILSFNIFASQAIFIYDPYTFRISDISVSQIKKIGARRHISVKPIVSDYKNFPEIYNNLSDKEKRKKIIISSYLYSMFYNNEEYKNLLNNSGIYLYGPLFDYENKIDKSNISIDILNKEKLEYFLKKCEEIAFFIPESVYGKSDSAEPEHTLISLLTENFYSLKNSRNIIKLPFSENMGKSSAQLNIQENSNSLTILCLRKISAGNRNLIKDFKGKILFFDYINSNNLQNSIYKKNDFTNSASLSYDYKHTLDKIFQNISEKSEKEINYNAVFSLFP